MTRAAKLHTIGYEAITQAELVATLAGAGVRLVADVREIANSRRPGFAKRSLSAALAEAGIGYVHLRALGTPKAGREANKRGDMASFEAIVEQSLSQPAAELALAELAELARARPTALLCLEADPARCHRCNVARRLAPMGFSVEHLATDQALPR